jgi:hypothetical protein
MSKNIRVGIILGMVLGTGGFGFVEYIRGPRRIIK